MDNPTNETNREPDAGFAAATSLAALFQSIKTITTREEDIVAHGDCPHCDAALRVLGAAGESKWHQCPRCLAVWVIAANAKLTDCGEIKQ